MIHIAKAYHYDLFFSLEWKMLQKDIWYIKSYIYITEINMLKERNGRGFD
jgi:hypothetical protein